MALARRALAEDRSILGAYAIGGGGRAAVTAFAEAGRVCMVCIGHDLDTENARLLREGRMRAVLHQDLRLDLRTACRHIMHAHGALRAVETALSAVQVITPFNLPPGL